MSALSLRSQLETSNRFLEIVTLLQGDALECPDQPRPVAAAHARDPGVRLRDIAAGPGSTERGACGIVTDLTTAGCGEVERRPPQPLPEAAAAGVAAVLEDDRYFGPDAPGGGEGDF